MKCRAKNSRKKRCGNDAKAKYLFLYCKDHKSNLWKKPYALLLVIATFATLFGAYLTIKNEFFGPFTATIQIVDWKNRIDNQEIYSNGGIVSFDGKKEYDNEITTTNKGKFNFNLPASYKKQSVRVYFHPKEDIYRYMKLDTTIIIHKNSTYYLKMYYKGIDEITRTVINKSSNEPFKDAIVEINGIIDTTDTNGVFTIRLPLVKQERYQKLTIKKDGYVDFVNNEFDMTNDNSHISWNFSKK